MFRAGPLAAFRAAFPLLGYPLNSSSHNIYPYQEGDHERLAEPRRPVGGNEHMIGHLISSGRKFHERREGGEAGTKRKEHPFLAGLWPAAVKDLPQDKQNGG